MSAIIPMVFKYSLYIRICIWVYIDEWMDIYIDADVCVCVWSNELFTEHILFLLFFFGLPCSLENNHPIIGLFDGPNPLERLLGLDHTESIVSMSLRDPLDNREMPPNGNKFINASCIRGVRQVCHSFIQSCSSHPSFSFDPRNLLFLLVNLTSKTFYFYF